MSAKKCTSVLLAALILFCNVGLAFNVHYCGGKIAKISSAYSVDSLVESNGDSGVEKDCCAKKSVTQESCCKNKLIKSGAKQDVIVKTISFQIDAPFVCHDWTPIVPDESVKFHEARPIKYYCNANAPPLYELHSQLIFYA